MVKIPFVALILCVAAFAQNYGFTIPSCDCRVMVNRDRSLTIEYSILFRCQEGKSSIDVVDIGMPSQDYDISSATAYIDGHLLPAIYPSSYIETGVEIHLGSRAIRPGSRGELEFSCRNDDMVFLDSEKDGYASVEFTPTWFDGDMLAGTTSFRLEMVFPEGATPDDVYYHDRAFTDSYVNDQGSITYVWEADRKLDSPFDVGISFPADLVNGPLREKPKEPLLSTGTIMILIVFFSVFLVFGFIVLAIVISVRKARRRREQYLPPSIGLEGSSVRRGLTAPMAALLLEEKLDRVFLMILFGLLRKGALTVDAGELKKTGTDQGLRSYEKAMLDIISPGKTIPPEGVMDIFRKMIDQLEDKMENYSLEKTREYYRSIIRSAWKMVMEDEDTSEAGRKLGSMFIWMLADRKFESRLDDLPNEYSIRLPAFINLLSSRGITSESISTVSLSRACSRAASFLENAAGNLVSDLTSMSRSVTATTNPVPVSTYRGSSSGSGCACACACAGCACACAGGGR